MSDRQLNAFEKFIQERRWAGKPSMIVYSELNAEEQAILGGPQFQTGEVVVVLNPWWLKHRVTGAQIRDKVKARVCSANGFWHPSGDGGGYSVEVEPLSDGTLLSVHSLWGHIRRVEERDIEGFRPNPLYPPG